MKRYVTLFMLIVLGCTYLSAAGEQHFEVKVGDFSTLNVVNSVNVVYVCDASRSGVAVFDARPGIANQVIFNNNQKGKLSVSLGPDSVKVNDLPTITVYSRFLKSATNESDSTLTIKSIAPESIVKLRLTGNGRINATGVDADQVHLDILTGNGTIKASGKCAKLNVTTMGTGSVLAEELQATDVNARLIGTSKIYCYIKGGLLSIKGSGTGKVYYRGTPKDIKSMQLGSIKAIKMD